MWPKEVPVTCIPSGSSTHGCLQASCRPTFEQFFISEHARDRDWRRPANTSYPRSDAGSIAARNAEHRSLCSLAPSVARAEGERRYLNLHIHLYERSAAGVSSALHRQ
ncbi:hypothetical protein BD310DRAFT_915521 [Dichomitus squalens]|uniref:Uncharacterized protein n=1 Tax=Dichomitus squalens TaxID=114155 RepID=A0A4Q9QAQ4_9APHY|nr:hypothetical protein BD310DRAFT_915521 [Dichomitus squalens]